MSDMSILRWRVEQQSQMIMKLKANLDESTAKLKVQEKINEDTHSINKIVNGQIEEEEDKFEAAERKFTKITADYKELLKSKDKMEAKSLALRKAISAIENDRKSSLSTLVDEKCVQVQKKTKLISVAQISLARLESEYSELMLSSDADVLFQEIEVLQTIQTRTTTELEKMTDDIETKLTNVITQLTTIMSQKAQIAQKRDADEDKYLTSNDELLVIIAEKHEEIKKLRSIYSNLEEHEETVKQNLAAIEMKLRKEKYLIVPELLMKKLTQELQNIYDANQKTLKEFEAYQKHAETLIQRELQLNRKFQLLTS